jgi:hypothetical protein
MADIIEGGVRVRGREPPARLRSTDTSYSSILLELGGSLLR